MTRKGKLRIVYGLVLATLVCVAVWGELVDVPLIFGQGAARAGFGGGNLSFMLTFTRLFLAVSFLIIAAPFVFLFVRPMGWGKFILLFAAFGWTFHGLIGTLMGLATAADFAPLFVAAGMMVILAIAHQVIDPSLLRRRDP